MSFSRQRDSRDDARTGSPLASLKRELWHPRWFADEADAERAVFESVEVLDNRERLHSSLGYVSPAAFEARHPTHTVNK